MIGPVDACDVLEGNGVDGGTSRRAERAEEPPKVLAVGVEYVCERGREFPLGGGGGIMLKEGFAFDLFPFGCVSN